MDKTYTDTKVTNNTNINHILFSFPDYYNAISLERVPLKQNLVKIHGISIILF